MASPRPTGSDSVQRSDGGPGRFLSRQEATSTYASLSDSLLKGSGAPSNGLGIDGQMYWDSTNGVLYGPKASGAWPAGLSLVGQAVSINAALPGDATPSPGGVHMSAATRALTAGRIYLLRYCPPVLRGLTLSAFSVVTAGGSALDPVEIGIYTAGTTLTRVATTGATTGLLNSTGLKTLSLAASVSPNIVYYVAIANATQASTAASVAGAGTDPSQFYAYGAAQPTAFCGVIDGALSSGALPTTIAASSVTWNGSAGNHPTVIMRTV